MNDPRHALRRQGAALARELADHVRREYPDPDDAGFVLRGAYEQLDGETVSLRNPREPFAAAEEQAGRQPVDPAFEDQMKEERRQSGMN